MSATDRALELVRTAAQAASDKLAEHIMAFDVSEQLVITDAFLLCSAPNDRQVKAIVDYAEIVVHVQHEEERSFYALERLWRDCPLIALPDTVTSGRSR
jgi:ribosome-associated protein